MSKNEIPVCPLISIGSGIDMVCSQTKCAWYVPSLQKCSMYLLAYNALLEANQKQRARAQAAHQ